MPFRYADWTGDGRLDLWRAFVNQSTGKTEIFVYPGNGSGDWNMDNPTIFTTDIVGSLGPIESQNYLLKDHNYDGKLDLIDFDRKTVFKNNGQGSLIALTPYGFPDEMVPLVRTITDINGDGIDDMVTAIPGPLISDKAISFRIGNANGTFGNKNFVVSIPHESVLIRSADFNGDGKMDLFVNRYGATSQYRVLLNNGKGGFTVLPEATILPDYAIEWAAFSDFNNDDHLDIVVPARLVGSSPPVTKLFVLYGNGTGAFSATEYPVFRSDESARYQIADFNGDNKTDIIGYGTYHHFIQINKGSGNFERHDYPRALGFFSSGDLFADIDGDGNADLLSPAYGSSLIQNSFGQYITHFNKNICKSSGQTVKADFDGDGEGDIVRWNPATGLWTSRSARWLTQASASPQRTFTWGLGSLGDVPAPGDYDGDGLTDYAVYRNSSGYWYIRRSSDSGTMIVGWGLPGDIAVPNDYDGGGQTDIAVFRPSEGNWYIVSTETQQMSFVHFGTNGDVPVPGDWDGDGKTDAAVYRPSSGVWYYLRSTDGGWGGASWGLSTDKPAPGDFDGDGKMDFAVVRDPGDWYILRSSDNSFNFIHWGTTGDITIPFYRHSLAAEIVVFRPTTWQWFNFSLRDSGVYQISYSAVGDIPVKFGLPNN